MDKQNKPALETMSIEELEEFVAYECESIPCTKCKRYPNNFSGLVEEAKVRLCADVRNLAKVILFIKKNELQSTETKFKGNCTQCENLDKEYKEKSGYCFCKHWHNFTTANGFCNNFSCKNYGQDVI